MNLTITSLVCHAHVDIALACLGSLRSNSQEGLLFRLHDDGSLTQADQERLAHAFPGVEIVTASQAEDHLSPLLAAYPECRAFRTRSPLARKLLDAVLLAEEGKPFLFCDSDVWWFRPVVRLGEGLADGVRIVFMRDVQESYALWPWNLWPADHLPMPRRVNTGLILADRSVLDLDFLEWFLRRRLRGFKSFPNWVEQTCWAALGQRAGCGLWHPEQVRVIQDARCLRGPPIAGHFTTDRRWLLPSGAKPSEGRERAEALKIVPPERLSALDFARSQAGILMNDKGRKCLKWSISVVKTDGSFLPTVA